MQVTDPNNVKIYNLSAGKSLPEWLTERKRRALIKKDTDVRHRIELIQDFDMPGVSTTIKTSKDGQYILATGIYKPRVKCFDTNNLSLKFERCFDSEVVTFEILSDDYSKLVFLHSDRYIEFHAAHGRYYKLRIPKFGRDMKYEDRTCDLYVVGASSDIYRLNLERGQFMTPFTSGASAINRIAVNPTNHLIICGTEDGKVEAWDPRSHSLVGNLDCAFSCINETKQLQVIPSVTALSFNGGFNMGVGTASGQILLYDIRSNKPYLVKDHMFGLPIKDIEFHYQQDLVYSLDRSVLKIWDRNNGKPYTSIGASTEFNNLCVLPNSGLLFIATENTKMQTYYIPSLGPAPKWAAFLDSLTEELEESHTEVVYDDYKFLTKAELEKLGLEHLIGTNLLRAYMHGYFINVHLYKKASSISNAFEFEEYRKKLIRQTIEKTRSNRIQVNKLPAVNKDLALKLMNDQQNEKKKKTGDLLKDDRFKALFENADFEVDKNTDDYRLLNPVLSRFSKTQQKEAKKIVPEFEAVDEEVESVNSSDESSIDESSDDEDRNWVKEIKKQHKVIKREHNAEERLKEMEEKVRQPKLLELRQGAEFKGINKMTMKINRSTLGDRLEGTEESVKYLSSIGSRQMTFSCAKNKRNKTIDDKHKKHREERRKSARPTFGVRSKKQNTFKRKR